MKSGDSPAEERGDLSFSVDQQIPQSPIMNSPSYDKSCASSSVGQQMPSSSSMERTSSQLTDEEMGSKPSLKGKSKQALALFNYLDSRRSSENAEHEFALLQCRCISLAYRTFRDPCMKEELSKHVLNGIKSFLLSIGRVGDYPLSLKVYCDAALGGRLEEARLTNSDTWTRALQKGRDFFKSNLEGYTIQWCGFVLSLIQVACSEYLQSRMSNGNLNLAYNNRKGCVGQSATEQSRKVRLPLTMCSSGKMSNTILSYPH
jgi:hypothetical protein